MNSKKKRYGKAASAFLILMLLLMSLVLPVFAAEIPEPTDDFYVNDFSGILSQETIDYIMETNIELHEKTGAQIVVVTMDSLEGDSIEEFSTDVFRYFGIGSAEEDNGVLLLLAKDDREVRIEVGYGLEGAINDAKAGRILDTYSLPYFEHDKWDEGILNGFKAIEKEVKAEYPAAFSDQEMDNEESEPQEYKAPGFFETWQGWWLISIPISLIMGIVLYKTFESYSKYAILAWLGIVAVFFMIRYNVWIAILAVFVSGVAALFGYCAVAPDDGSGSSSSYSSSSSSSSRSSSRSSGSRSSHSGGGGRSGGGGASRKF
ncbi:MAG: TPM domain-containing protein [Lachnospiraceae bacterium]|nr:TPM domain-containing protein [Lachnospiraceae bacterium]